MPNVEHSTDDHGGGVASAVRTNRLSGRLAVLSAIAGFVVLGGGVSGFLFFAAAGFSVEAISDPMAQLAVGGNSADVFRWASLADLFGYLLVAPLVAYLYHRFREDPRIVLYTAAGFASILIGAMGAIIFLTAGPPLLRDYASATGAQRASIATTFTSLYQIVVIGFWQTLEGILGGVWLLGIGVNLYRVKSRALSLVAFAVGGVFLVLAAGRMLGL